MSDDSLTQEEAQTLEREIEREILSSPHSLKTLLRYLMHRGLITDAMLIEALDYRPTIN